MTFDLSKCRPFDLEAAAAQGDEGKGGEDG